jgi:hypothetical protein
MPNHKADITQRVIGLLPSADTTTLDQALTSWYRNIRKNGGLRLTDLGYQVFLDLKLEAWSVEITDLKNYISKTLLLQLDNKLQFPYYIDFKKKKIVFYNSKEAMLANLYGNLTEFLKHYT